MRELSRTNLYSYMNDNTLINMELLLEIFKINSHILKGIEEQFYAERDNEYSIYEIYKIEEISRQLQENLSSLNSEFFEELKIELLFLEIENIVENYKIKKSPKTHYYFNSILKILIKWSNDQIFKNLLGERVKEHIHKLFVEDHNMVFLSYAFEDHLYTIGLFYYFYSKGIYLYIDWLHNDYIPKGAVLKNSLYTEMNKCNQLLLLQSINMELNLSGNPSIKPWCAWEIGSFYRKNMAQDKFYISLYKHPFNYKRNIILDGIEPMSYIEAGYIK